MGVLKQATEIKENKSVGQEFIEWAEQYWLIDKLFHNNNPDKFAGEVCDYNYMRNIFVQKIDNIIKDRL